MKKIITMLYLIILGVMVVGCGSKSEDSSSKTDESSSSISSEELKTLEDEIHIVYDVTIPAYPYYLFGYSTIPFSISDCYDENGNKVDELVAGDTAVIYYTGTITILDSYPGRVVFSDENAIDHVLIKKASLIELSHSPVPGDTREGIYLTDDTYEITNENAPDYLILEDKSLISLELLRFGVNLIPNDTLIYASYKEEDVKLDSYKKKVITILGLYAYNPR